MAYVRMAGDHRWEKTCKIEAGGRDGSKPPSVFNLKNEQICNGRADQFLIEMRENFDENLKSSLFRALDPFKRTALEMSLNGGFS